MMGARLGRAGGCGVLVKVEAYYDGSLSDILPAVSTHNAVPKEELLKQLGEG